MQVASNFSQPQACYELENSTELYITVRLMKYKLPASYVCKNAPNFLDKLFKANCSGTVECSDNYALVGLFNYRYFVDLKKTSLKKNLVHLFSIRINDKTRRLLQNCKQAQRSSHQILFLTCQP